MWPLLRIAVEELRRQQEMERSGEPVRTEPAGVGHRVRGDLAVSVHDAILAGIEDADARDAFDRVCQACVQELPLSGAAVALIVGRQPLGTLGGSDPTSLALLDAQYELGEGPCLDAHRSGLFVEEPDLTVRSARWPLFGPIAVEAGVQATFAAPLRLDGVAFGALSVYRDEPGVLPAASVTGLQRVAEALTSLLLVTHAESAEGSAPTAIDDLVEQRAIVHQAAGMISVQLDVTVTEALVALRARAFRLGTSDTELAGEIVRRRVRLDDL